MPGAMWKVMSGAERVAISEAEWSRENSAAGSRVSCQVEGLSWVSLMRPTLKGALPEEATDEVIFS